MKFVKSKFAQKLIIILIALMIFNIAVPKEVSAWDLGGILLKPITSLILTNLISIDVSIGIILNGLSIATNIVGGIIELFVPENHSGLSNISAGLQQLFIGPDTIFSGNVRILDANIFEVENFSNPTDFLTMFNSVGTVNGLASATAPGYDLIVSLKEGIATVYKALRDICGYIMLAGLIFTGIRILLSSNIPTKKTQYLMLLQDWLIGMVLLIFSHVIMVGVFYISDTLVEALSMELNGVGGINTNLILQCLLSFDSAEQIICLIMLGYLIYLTVIFTISYMKRLMWVCVLIVIAPIVSIMYAFGNATKNIYTKWLREYIMTVLIQPFHLVVYYVLVSIPLNISNSTGGVSLGTTNFLEIIYCLVAISFIRPAEKYIRDLFGMGQGIVGQASVDSGKQTLDAIVKTVTTIGTTVATAGAAAAAVVATGGAAAPVVGGALTAAGTGTAAAVGGEALGALGTEAAGALGGEVLGAMGGEASALLDAGTAAPKDMVLEKYASEGFGQNANGEYFNPWTDEYDASYDPHMDKKYNPDYNLEAPKDEVLEKYKSEGFRQNANGEYYNPWTDEYDADYDPHKDKGFNPDYNPEEKKADTDNENNSNANTKSESSGKNITAASVNITAGSVSMQGGNLDGSKVEGIKTAVDNEQEEKKGEEESKEDKDNDKKNNDNHVDVQSPGESEEGNIRNKSFLSNFMAVTTGQKGIFEVLGERPKSKRARNLQDKIASGSAKYKTLVDEADTKPKKFVARVKSGAYELATGFGMFSGQGKLLESLKAFEKAGGITKLHQGFHEIRDTFFVGGAPQDWKATNARMAERDRANIEQLKYEASNVNNNKWLVDIYEAKLRDQYKNNKNYSPERIKDMAEEKAKSKLKSLADTYVPLGVMDMKIAYECDQDRKKYGGTAEEVVVQRKGYEQFNINQQNVAHINERFSENVNNVSEVIPPAREYYSNGYRRVEDMALVHELTRVLSVSTEKGMQLDQALRRKGGSIKIDYDKAGIEGKRRESLDNILKQYSAIQEGKK